MPGPAPHEERAREARGVLSGVRLGVDWDDRNVPRDEVDEVDNVDRVEELKEGPYSAAPKPHVGPRTGTGDGPHRLGLGGRGLL